MKTINTYTIGYVVSESDIEDKKIQALITDVKNEKFGEAKQKIEDGYLVLVTF